MVEWQEAHLRLGRAAQNDAISSLAEFMRVTHPKRRYRINGAEAEIAVAGTSNRVVVIASPSDREWAIQLRKGVSAVHGKTEAMMVGAPDADNAMDGKQIIFQLAEVFVSNALHLLIALVARMNRYQVRLQK